MIVPFLDNSIRNYIYASYFTTTLLTGYIHDQICKIGATNSFDAAKLQISKSIKPYYSTFKNNVILNRIVDLFENNKKYLERDSSGNPNFLRSTPEYTEHEAYNKIKQSIEKNYNTCIASNTLLKNSIYGISVALIIGFAHYRYMR